MNDVIRTSNEKVVPRWTDRSDKEWPLEVVPAWGYDAAVTEIRAAHKALRFAQAGRDDPTPCQCRYCGGNERPPSETRACDAMREAGRHVFCGATPNWIDHAGDCDALPCTCGLSEWLNANKDLLGITLSHSQKANSCVHAWSVKGPPRNPEPHQFCDNGCGLMWKDRPLQSERE